MYQGHQSCRDVAWRWDSYVHKAANVWIDIWSCIINACVHNNVSPVHVRIDTWSWIVHACVHNNVGPVHVRVDTWMKLYSSCLCPQSCWSSARICFPNTNQLLHNQGVCTGACVTWLQCWRAILFGFCCCFCIGWAVCFGWMYNGSRLIFGPAECHFSTFLCGNCVMCFLFLKSLLWQCMWLDYHPCLLTV